MRLSITTDSSVNLLGWLQNAIPVTVNGGSLFIVDTTIAQAWTNTILPLMDKTVYGDLHKHITGTVNSSTVTIFGHQIFVVGGRHHLAEQNYLRGCTVASAYVKNSFLLPCDFNDQLLGRATSRGAFIHLA